jgi:hypothetical protein
LDEEGALGQGLDQALAAFRSIERIASAREVVGWIADVSQPKLAGDDADVTAGGQLD